MTKRNQCCCQYLYKGVNRYSNKRSNWLASKQVEESRKKHKEKGLKTRASGTSVTEMVGNHQAVCISLWKDIRIGPTEKCSCSVSLFGPVRLSVLDRGLRFRSRSHCWCWGYSIWMKKFWALQGYQEKHKILHSVGNNRGVEYFRLFTSKG
jgi:hypothetical protein